MAMAHKSGNSGKVLGGGFEYKIPVKNWAHGLEAGGKSGVFTFDDFLPYAEANYDLIEADTGSTVDAVVASLNGEVALTLDATAEDEVYFGAKITAAAGAGGIGAIKLVDGKVSAAAIRFKVSQIAVASSFFVGWMEVGYTIAANALVDSTGVPVANDGVGLHRKNHKTQCDVIHGASLAAPTTLKSSAHALLADTYLNLSLSFDGTDARVFIDGVQQGDKVARTDLVADGIELRPVALMKGTTGAVEVLTIDSFAGANER